MTDNKRDNKVDNKKEMLISVMVLSVIAVISGILLALVFQFTKITQEELNRRISAKLNTIYLAQNGYEQIEVEQNSNITGFYKAVGEDYSIIIAKGQGYNGSLEMYVSFIGQNIVKLTPGRNSDTPGMKEKALTEEYLSQYYVDIYNNVFEFSSEGFDVASGATYTSNGVLGAVNNAVTLYKMDLENKTAEDLLQENLNSIHHSENGYDKLIFSNDNITGFYKAKDEDYYIVSAKGQGYNENIKIEVFVSFVANDIVNLKIGDNGETGTRSGVQEVFSEEYLGQYYISINNIIFSVTKKDNDGNIVEQGNIDAVTKATKSADGVAEAVNNGVTLYKSYLGGL